MCWYPHKYWSQHLKGGERHEKFKASLRYIVESHPRLHDTSSQVTGEKGTKEQERKKEELKKKCEKAKWTERTEEKDLASFILTDSPRKTSRSPHPCAALHTVNFFLCVQFTLGLFEAFKSDFTCCIRVQLSSWYSSHYVNHHSINCVFPLNTSLRKETTLI